MDAGSPARPECRPDRAHDRREVEDMRRELIWRKSSRSGSNGGQCVELAGMDNKVAIRDSKDRHGPVLVVSRTALREAMRTLDER
ncbi:DUF397 domain-containing protein [Actinomadura sp. 3N508]|uniref:DUF397 domain-containing protein n=1 Tax=Actinomadura sp. 3N508 TaxID=3375153 RepID=UPI0037A42C29